jgi:hypothetical protein
MNREIKKFFVLKIQSPLFIRVGIRRSRFWPNASRWALILTALLTVSSWGQNGVISVAKINGSSSEDTVLVGQPIRFVMRYTNNTGQGCDFSNGWRISSPDGAVWNNTEISVLLPLDWGACSSTSALKACLLSVGDGRSADTLGLLWLSSRYNCAFLPPGFDDTLVAITVSMPVGGSAGKHICVDSSFFTPGGTWKWVQPDSCTITGAIQSFTPEWLGLTPQQTYVPNHGYCVYISTTSCCVGTTGNVNLLGIVDLADLSALVSYLTGGGYVLLCVPEANVNNTGIVDLADLSALVSYLTGGGYVLPSCQ